MSDLLLGIHPEVPLCVGHDGWGSLAAREFATIRVSLATMGSGRMVPFGMFG
jgi:hypothetical protein